MNENDIYGVWLQQAVGEGSRKVPQLLMYFGSCKGVYEADEQELVVITTKATAFSACGLLYEAGLRGVPIEWPESEERQ